MSLIKSHVSLPTGLPRPSSREPANTVVTVPPELDGRQITEEKLVVDTFINNTALNVDSYNDTLTDITGLVSGTIIKVTYLSRNTPTTDIQTRTVDMTTAFKDSVHVALTQIRDFELRVQSEFGFEWKEETNNAGVDIEAIVLPGFNPQVEDTFLYEMRNGKIGVFKVSSIQRLALGQDTYHKIQATLQDWLTPDIHERIRRQTTAVRYFDKKKFLTGNHAYLESDYYRLKKDLKDVRVGLINVFYNNYYDSEISSFVRPDHVYDPYAVEYWNKKISCMDAPGRPSQLLVAVSNYKRTLWSMFTGGPLRHLEQLEAHGDIHTKVNSYWDANVTSLLGRPYLVIGDEEAWTHGGRTPYDPVDQMDRTMLPYDRTKDIARSKEVFDELSANLAIEVYKSAHKHEAYTLKFAPPYPILSNKQLESIWRKLEGKSNGDVLNEEDAQRASGFIHWYRTTYPGTLSKYELENRWRIGNGKVDSILAPTDILELKSYIADYRSRHTEIRSDLELECTWRIEHHIPQGQDLSEDEARDLRSYVAEYRRYHGYCVNDTLGVGTDAGFDVDKIEEISPIFEDREMVTDIPYHPEKDHAAATEIRDYVVSESFYQGSSGLEPFEDVLYRALILKNINPKEIYEAVYVYLTQPASVEAFYRTLISIYLVDRALRWIHEDA